MGELISKNEGIKESLLLYVQREHVTIKARRYLDEGSFFDGFLGQMLQSRAYRSWCRLLVGCHALCVRSIDSVQAKRA